MKYFLIAGEASGDLHASRLMNSLKKFDPNANFRFIGGELMSNIGGTRVQDLKKISYMGFIPVICHLPEIIRTLKNCKKEILDWKPDAVILIDYPSFNLKIAKFVKKNTNIPIYYYISPKIWAWKEWRIKSIKKYVDEMFSILPFETEFYKNKHNYNIRYIGNPTVEEVVSFKSKYTETKDEFCKRHNISTKPIIALLPGSRNQEIISNLPSMIEAASHFEDYQIVIAAAPSIEVKFYKKFISTYSYISIIQNETYQILTHSTAAIVTSGTATLETSLLNIPQVVCYRTAFPTLSRIAFNHIIKVNFISLVNLIANKEIVKELIAEKFNVYNIANELYRILPNKKHRELMIKGYDIVKDKLGNDIAPQSAANIIVYLLQRNINA